MEVKNKIIDEINSLLTVYEAVCNELAEISPKTPEEMKELNLPQNRFKRLKGGAAVSLKLRLFVKLHSLHTILKQYFNTDISNTYSQLLVNELAEYDKVNQMISLKDNKVTFGKEFEDYMTEFEEKLKNTGNG